jgi:hypothetical protein
MEPSSAKTGPVDLITDMNLTPVTVNGAHCATLWLFLESAGQGPGMPVTQCASSRGARLEESV